ncbi:MAG: TolC family protein, partial [Deltaproteobacteria bacterium]|nr:TolC family protein [Deltaproteobacteria bacterium]
GDVAAAAGDVAAAAGDVAVPAQELPEDLPAPEPGPEVTLAEAFELARARHPSLRAVGLELDKADAMLHQAWGALLPRLSADLSYYLADEETVVDFSDMVPIPGLTIDPIVVRRQHVAQAEVSLQAPLFAMPIYSAIETASLGRSMAGLAREEAERQLLTGVAVAWYGALAAGEILAIHEAAYDTARQRLRTAQVRLALGAGLAIDAARAELEVETARLAHEAAVLGYGRAREALAGLLVMDERPVPALGELPEAPPEADAEALVSQALEGRSDVELKRLQIDLAEQNLWTAWTSFFPTLGAGFQYTAELTEPSSFGGRRHMWTMALVLSVPLYDEPRYGVLDQRRAEVLQAEAELEAAELAVRTEVRSALQEYESTLASIDTAERQVVLAEEALRLAEIGRTAGASTSLDVDEAQQRVNQARIQVTVQRYQSRLAFARLLLLCGSLPG